MSIIASYKTLDKPKVDYSRYTETQIKALKLTQRIEEKSLNVIFNKPVETFECSNFAFLMTCFRHYKNSHMPFSGSLSEQPNKIIEAMNVLQALENEMQEKEMKKQAALNKRKK